MIQRRAARHFDYGLVLLAAALVAYGGLLIYSASLTAYPDGIASLSHPVVRQAMFAVFGLAMMGIVAWMDYRMFGQMAPALYALAILILVVVLFLGDSAFGSRRTCCGRCRTATATSSSGSRGASGARCRWSRSTSRSSERRCASR